MTRYMVDAINPGQFPGSITVPGRGVQPVSLRAGYINGRWPTALQAGTEVSIDVNAGAPQADVLDIETGDATPDAAPGWVRAHRASSGERAVLYCNRSVRPAVAAACAGAGLLPGRDFWWWIATLDGTTSLPDMGGVVAVQVWGANYFSGWNIDVSIVYDDSWKGTDDMPTADEVAAAVWSHGLGAASEPGVGPADAGTYLRFVADQSYVTRQRVMGELQQRFLAPGPDGEPRLVGGDAPGAVPCAALDTADGHFLVQQIAALAAKVDGATAPQVDAAALATALLADDTAVAKLGDAIAAGLATRVHNG